MIEESKTEQNDSNKASLGSTDPIADTINLDDFAKIADAKHRKSHQNDE